MEREDPKLKDREFMLEQATELVTESLRNRLRSLLWLKSSSSPPTKVVTVLRESRTLLFERKSRESVRHLLPFHLSKFFVR